MLLPIFEAMQNSAFTTTVQNTWWAGATFNVVHLLALAVFAGALLLVDLRLLGAGLRQQPVTRLAAEARPWLLVGLAGLFITGAPQMITLAVRNYYNFFFWVKMAVLVFALIYTFTIRQSVVSSEEAGSGSLQGKLVGALSIVLWLVVTATGRLIGLT
jgi:putative copper export protein